MRKQISCIPFSLVNIDHLKIRKLENVRIVTKHMYQCQHTQCTLEHITKDASALIVGSAFQGHGCYKDMFALIQVINYDKCFRAVYVD